MPDPTSRLKRTKQVHSTWYREQYPDVDLLGMDPAEHYLKYGAELGRNPGKNFDTSFYLEQNPKAARSGMNPLLHYAEYGEKQGYRRKPANADPAKEARKRIDIIRGKLLSLGFTDRPLAEFTEIASNDDNPAARALAARELALWHMREKSEEGYRKALEYIAKARENAPDLYFRSRLATAELLCHYQLSQLSEGCAVYDRAALAGEVDPDVMLAWANFQPTPEARIAWINQVLRQYGIAPVALTDDTALPPYDRLTAAAPPAKVTDGPLVTVLIAAYDAAEMLPTALRSLQEQSWQNLEIIVIDDYSPTPDTADVAEHFAAADPRIHVIRMPENGGAYVARNAGLDAANGTYVTLHDADDWSHPAKIETQVRFMEENPEAMGCTSQQARATSDLAFTRWTGEGYFIITNTSSFLFRRDPMRAQLGYWDTVRFSADNELIRRMQAKWGKGAVRHLPTGPLSFQRDGDSSIVADDALGINGFLFGARRDYRDAQQYHHEQAGTLKYTGERAANPFPVPALMKSTRPQLETPHFPVVLASDFRMRGGSAQSCAEDLKCAHASGIRIGIFEMFRYDLGDRTRASMLEEIREQVDGDTVQVLTYGQRVTCDLLLLRYPPILQHRQRYVPDIDARDIRVIVNQPPMSDYSPEGVVRYELADCAENIRHYFGKDATWHPIGPLVRDAMTTHHADQIHHIHLAETDWHNIIDIKGWSRGPRRRGPGDRLRIGRHSRDSWHKWPDSAADIRAAYPGGDDVEVHVLGGAETARSILGAIPANWVVHDFGAMHPRDFLAGIDVWINFAHPDWVESFGRTIIEAMAVGVPVILPEIYRPLFRDAALYATPQTAVEVARKLYADPAAYDAQVEKARRYVAEQFSYEMHIERLKTAGVQA